jgi:hypothetical protein
MKALMPNAVFVGFTGTPLLKQDKQTSLEVFGGYIHTYKFSEAVEDEVILDLVYEARDIDQHLGSPEKIDAWFDAKTKGLNDWQRAALREQWGMKGLDTDLRVIQGLQKALRQGGLSQVPGVDPSEWPHAGAKLVVAWVGNEDDCSNPNRPTDPTNSLFFGALDAPGKDVCTADESNPIGQQKLLPIAGYADFFTNLGRPFGAAFIYSATNCRLENGNTVCDPGACIAGASGGPPVACPAAQIANCTGASNGTRFHDLATALQAKKVATLEASVCDSDFASTLQNIAKLVQPPAGLSLPSTPAASEVAVLRIESADGKTSRQCSGPLANGGDQSKSDWWFVDCAGTSSAPVFQPTACLFINLATQKCEPNPGETYIAQYLGLVPPGGCSTASDCTRALGGPADDSAWTCAKSSADAAAVGTCVCNPGT